MSAPFPIEDHADPQVIISAAKNAWMMAEFACREKRGRVVPYNHEKHGPGYQILGSVTAFIKKSCKERTGRTPKATFVKDVHTVLRMTGNVVSMHTDQDKKRDHPVFVRAQWQDGPGMVTRFRERVEDDGSMPEAGPVTIVSTYVPPLAVAVLRTINKHGPFRSKAGKCTGLIAKKGQHTQDQVSSSLKRLHEVGYIERKTGARQTYEVRITARGKLYLDSHKEVDTTAMPATKEGAKPVPPPKAASTPAPTSSPAPAPKPEPIPEPAKQTLLWDASSEALLAALAVRVRDDLHKASTASEEVACAVTLIREVVDSANQGTVTPLAALAQIEQVLGELS